jgi:hypothetical protein
MSTIWLDLTSCSLSGWLSAVRKNLLPRSSGYLQTEASGFSETQICQNTQCHAHYDLIPTHCREKLVYYEQRDICGWWAGKVVDESLVQSQGLYGATEGKTVKNLRQLRWNDGQIVETLTSRVRSRSANQSPSVFGTTYRITMWWSENPLKCRILWLQEEARTCLHGDIAISLIAEMRS